MAAHNALILLLCLFNFNKISYEMLASDNTCTEDTERESVERRICNYRCEYYRVVVSKIITCNNITIDVLKSYTELRELYPYSYPLTLRVLYSDITELPTSTFKNFKNLTTLYMEDIKLKTILPAAFNYLDKLKEIYLGKNELTTISDGIFNTLTMLENLDLSRNRLQTITNYSFVGIGLKSLNLSHNSISHLSEALLKSLKYLYTLDISHNNLSDISTFYGFSLGKLDMSHNNIKFVDFEMMQEANMVDLSFNNISQITNFNKSKANRILLSHNRLTEFRSNIYVSVLDFSHNNIQIIGGGLLSNVLIKLYISFNFISSLSADTFLGLYDLTHLYLDNNNLSAIPNSCLKDLNSLTHLNLSGNRLTYFNFGTFDNLVSLEVLDISNNNFKELPQFHSLEKLTDLYIQNNEISNINTPIVYKQFPILRQINLVNNTWSCHKLDEIVHKLRNIYKYISITKGNFLDGNNIYGIKCYDTFKNTDSVDESKAGINIDNSKLNSFFNEDFTKTLLYKYFNQDFKESDFFRYLEGLKTSINSSNTQNIDYIALNKFLEVVSKTNDTKYDFKNSEMYNYFNKDFKNSTFFKYLEDSRSNADTLEKVNANKLDEIAGSLKGIRKELENVSIVNKFNDSFKKTDMYNYFNKDFERSNFYKYLENLNARNVDVMHLDGTKSGKIEKLIGYHEEVTEIPNYTGLLSFLAVSLVIIIFIMVTIAYRQFFHLNKYVLKKEEVELI